jgi:hypothetical protein
LCTTKNNSIEHVCRIQFNGWRRITEHLVRVGLGLKEFAMPAVLMAHCKKSLRQLLVNGEAKLPDLAHDADWKAKGDGYNATDNISDGLKMMLKTALQVQYCFHGLEATYTLRFTPIGSDQLWGFSFDDEQMESYNPPELRRSRDGRRLPPVQLVCAPMLAVQERYDQGVGKVLIRKAPMTVVTPYVFAGNEAERYTWPDEKEDVEKRRVKKRRLEVGLPAEDEVEEGGGRLRRSDRVQILRQEEVIERGKRMKDLLNSQEQEAKDLRDKQKTEVEALLNKHKRIAERLVAKQQRRAKELPAK